MTRYITGIIAVLMAAGLFAFTRPSQQTQESPGMMNYYFQFTSTHGNESDETQWKEISQSTYNGLPCSGTAQGCKITTTSVTNPSAPLGERQISLVTVDDDNVPQPTGTNTQVANQP